MKGERTNEVTMLCEVCRLVPQSITQPEEGRGENSTHNVRTGSSLVQWLFVLHTDKLITTNY